MKIQHFFKAQLVDHTGDGTLTDGGVLWEVVTPTDERVASCSTQEAAEDLERELNMALTGWCEEDTDDRVADCA